MRATIDKAGRLVIPKPLRDQIGMAPGEVDIEVDGAALRIAPVETEGLVRAADGWLIIPAAGASVTDEDVHALRTVDQR